VKGCVDTSQGRCTDEGFGWSRPLTLSLSLSGALYGRAIGLAVQALHYHYGDSYVFYGCKNTTTCITPAIYAIVGAAAVLAGVTRMTVSLVVIMIEVTNGLQYVLPLMFATMISKMVAEGVILCA
jgi:chloride channel 3/4/5